MQPKSNPENASFELLVNHDVNTPEVTRNLVNDSVNVEGLGCGVYELQVHRRDVPVDKELEGFINEQLNFSVPTQSLINLIKKRDTVKTQKARARSDRKLNEFERAEVLQSFDNKQAALSLAIEKARAMVQKGKTEKE